MTASAISLRSATTKRSLNVVLIVSSRIVVAVVVVVVVVVDVDVVVVAPSFSCCL